MKQSEWNLVHWPIRPEDKLPPERKVVLVFVEGSALPYCAYIRYAAGDKTCPYFVVYRADKGADVWAWCDCLPKGPDRTKAEFYNHNFEGRGFPKRDGDDLPTQESEMKSGINVEAGETGGHPHISIGPSPNTYDTISAILNRNTHAGSKRWLWNVSELEFTTENKGQRLDFASAEMVAQGYIAKGLDVAPQVDTKHTQTQETNMRSGINVDAVRNTLNRNAHLGIKSWLWNDSKGDFSNREHHGRLDVETAAMVAKGYIAQEPMAGPGETGGYPAFAENADKNNCSTPPCCGTKPCIFPDPFVKNSELFGEGAAPEDPRQPGPTQPEGSEPAGPALLHELVIESLHTAHSAITQLADGFHGPESRKIRMGIDIMAERIEQSLKAVRSFRIEEHPAD